ncbi:hypothetical protein GALMADRAFT_136208 [Galerina marginata CBS 339.88]|uniref:Uncharacterized protein n=1 Tax=Galerina marginata (strain CBS 339.88) TaxID=685588 RepID=A0A067TDC4_GALM3|nr:hypothetical protein GALMADRAFT_136208 [Galerina marginata CBS 339.88]
MTSSSNSPEIDNPVVNLLCRPWHADSYDGHVILLQPDGTGEITSQAELNLFLAAHIEWKIINSTSVPESSAQSHSLLSRFKTASAPKVLDATIEITITKQSGPLSLIPIIGEHAQAMVGGHLLLASAFKPRVFNIIVERGEFVPPLGFDRKKPRRPFPLFGLRLVFDESPYPGKGGWQPERAAMLEDMRQFEKTAFVAERLGCDSGSGACVLM